MKYELDNQNNDSTNISLCRREGNKYIMDRDTYFIFSSSVA